MANSIKSELSVSDTVKKYSDRLSQVAAYSARAMYDISERQRQQQNALNEMLAEASFSSVNNNINCCSCNFCS